MSIFKTSLATTYCVLMHTKTVCFCYLGVIETKSVSEYWSSSGSWWLARGNFMIFFFCVCVFVFIINIVWRAFSQTNKKTLYRLWKTACDRFMLSAQVSVFAFVFMALAACKIVAIQTCLLNYIYTKTTDPHTRQAFLPASRKVSQQPNTVRLTLISLTPVYFS